MIESAGYSLVAYGMMMDCAPRMDAYDQALRRAVTPGCTVIDIGAGFGAFCLLACKYGAGKVIAIEPDPSIELLMPLARANGFAERIEIVRDMSTRYAPEYKADVVVIDCRGNLPLFQHNIDTIRDARERFLAPEGTLIPLRDIIRVALVSSPPAYRYVRSPWKNNRYGLDLSPGERFATNHTSKINLKPSALASEAVELAVLDYQTITSPNIDVKVELTAKANRVVHGLLVWFDAEIAEGIGFSNAPEHLPLVYQQKFMPFPEATRMAGGDRVSLRFRATFTGSEYIWNWDSDVIAAGTGAVRKQYRQSSFQSRIFSPPSIKTLASDFVPAPSEMLAIEQDCLTLVQDGSGRTLGNIAQTIMEKYPARFDSYQKALDHVVVFFKRYQEA